MPASNEPRPTDPFEDGAGRTESLDDGAGRAGPSEDGAGRTESLDDGAGRTESLDDGAGRTESLDDGAGRTESLDDGAGRAGPSEEGAGRTESLDDGAGRAGLFEEGAGRAESLDDDAGRAGLFEEGAGRAESLDDGAGRAGLFEEGAGRAGLFEDGAGRAGYVRSMFGEIAGRYDLMNTVMTGGRHRAWRRATARALVRPGDAVLDVGCGTGDLAFACAEEGAASVLGIDFAEPMLALARRKARERGAPRVSFAAADATRLPLADASVDVWCAAFVVRNIPELDAALAEARRVLRPGGRLGVLEIPRLERGWLRPFARFHFQRVVPLLGRAISGHRSAYRYLPVSVDHFLTVEQLSAHLDGSGFGGVQVRSFGRGTVALHVATRTERR